MTEHPAINFYPAEPFTVLPAAPAGQVREVGPIKPFALTVDIPSEDFAAMALPGTRHENACLPVRWLSAGEGLGVIQFCELEHHTENLAHRMTNPDGSVTTWRS